MPKISTICPECKTEFWYYASWPRKYCSRKCSGTANIANITRWKPSRFTASCEQCGQAFTSTPTQTRGRFCSLPCYGAWQSVNRRGENNPKFGRKFGRPAALPPPATKDCERCGETFVTKASHVERRRFCSRGCYAAWQSETGVNAGPNSPTWLGGYDPYYGPSWRSAKLAVRRRDLVCTNCGAPPNERSLDVHHVVPFRDFGRERHLEANDPANLVALCNVCHTAREWGTSRRAS